MAEDNWTLMFFFAGDNGLAPGMVSQLKAIKDAGFHERANVIVRYDPNEKGALTTIFEVNRQRKLDRRNGLKDSPEAAAAPVVQVGDGEDSFVRNLREDVLKRGNGRKAVAEAAPPTVGGQPLSRAAQTLWEFLAQCQQTTRARHYMLFLLGHGMIVGNDAFLPDENPDTAISLRELGAVLRSFSDSVRKGEGEFELVGMHSCSMSAVEVAYELKGTARYMMATEGVSFVGSWPYRQLLKKIFNQLRQDGGRGLDVRALLNRLFFLSKHNSVDYMFAGFSSDLALCNLSEAAVGKLDDPLRRLTRALKRGLGDGRRKADRRVLELILLAHLKAQSYYQETYADLYDFCLCLSRECEKEGLQGKIRSACLDVMGALDPRCALDVVGSLAPSRSDAARREGALKQLLRDNGYESVTPVEAKADAEPKGSLSEFDDRPVVYSQTFGPAYQYSHGLSIFFPWSRPIEDSPDDRGGPDGDGRGGQSVRQTIMQNYEGYAFTTEFRERDKNRKVVKDDSWLSFLELYFARTMREPRPAEDGAEFEVIKEAVGTTGFAGVAGSLAGPGKTLPTESGGGGCTCPSIKNYPMTFVLTKRRRAPDGGAQNGGARRNGRGPRREG